MRVVKCRIEGVGAGLLMHRFPLEPIEAIEKKTAQEQAEISAYRDPETKMLYVPAVNVQRCLVNGATFSKGKGRASLQKQVAACVIVGPEERLSLGVDKYDVSSLAVVVPATKGRVIRHRPLIKKWGIEFEVEYDERLLTETQLRRVVDDSGTRVGLLDFRPEKKGPYGRFVVTLWEALGGKDEPELPEVVDEESDGAEEVEAES
jgi:hypothetical protein